MSNPFETPEFAEPVLARRKLRLKRVGVLSAGIFGAAAGVLGGLLVGGIMFLVSALGAAAGNANGQQLGPLVGMGATAIVIVPLLYGVIFFLAGLFYAFIYNLIASVSGGIEVEFEQG